MSVMVDFSIFPVDKGEELSGYVARAVKIIRDSGLDFTLGSMGTCIEGEWDDVMAVIGRCFKELKQDCNRLNLAIKVDYRKGRSGRMAAKVKSVESKL